MGELLVLIAIGVLFFGARRLPELGGSLLCSFIAFKKGLKGEEKPPPREVTDYKEAESRKKKS